MIKERYYFTLRDLIDEDVEIENVGFKYSLFRNFGLVFQEGTNTKELYKSILVKYGYEYILYIDIMHHEGQYIEEPTIEELKTTYLQEVQKKLLKIRAWLDESQFRFDKLIETFDASKDDLLKPVKTTSKTKFNDTPQTTTSGLDGDEYATTFTVNENDADVVTKIQRLNEIRLYWNSIFSEWEQEFGKKFVYYL